MKKTMIIMLLFIATAFVNAQGLKETGVLDSITNETSDLVAGLTDFANLADIDTIKELFIHYTQEAIEGSKEAVKSGVGLVETAIEMLMTESTIIVKQYLLFLSFQSGIYLAMGFWMIWFSYARVQKYFRMPLADVAKELDRIAKGDKRDYTFFPSVMQGFNGVHYRSGGILFLYIVSRLSILIGGVAVVYTYLFVFVKVTFFPKLYLVEQLIQYIQ